MPHSHKMARSTLMLPIMFALILLGALLVVVVYKVLTPDSQLFQQPSRSNGLSAFRNVGLANPGKQQI